jgi:hypothetical protein
VPLEKVGATPTDGATTQDINVDDKTSVTQSVVSPNLVKYKILVGEFKNDIPTEVLDAFLELGKVVPKHSGNGTILYLYGEFSTYAEAQAALEKAKAAGLKTAYMVGDFNGRIISGEEAKNLLKQ